MTVLRRQFRFGPDLLFAEGPAAVEAPFVIAGPRMYAIGRGSGAISPIGVEHLVGEMGGIWAHPFKVADGFTLALRDTTGAALPLADGLFTEAPHAIEWAWYAAPLRLSRRDQVLPGTPTYAMQLTLANQGAASISGTLELQAHLKFQGCWFGGMPCAGGSYAQVDALVLGHDELQPTWGIAFGAAAPPDSAMIEPGARGALATLGYGFSLEPGALRVWTLLLCVSQTGGSAAAAADWHARIDSAGALFADDGAELLRGMPALSCADDTLRRDFVLAQTNLRMLEADYPATGPYFLAGLPEYPQLFGCDTTYSIPGAAAAGFSGTARNALLALAAYAERACGRVPHEITTNGRVFNPGNIQETPQFVIGVWDYLRWTGDMELARRLFPLCREGLIDYLPAIGGLAPRYPIGDGMVERQGMGSRKLDSACYLIAGLRALAKLATALGEPDAATYAAHADAVNRDFEQDWWLEHEGLYADSMHTDGQLQLDGHWTAVLPVQLGLAAPERAARVMRRLEAEFVNQWGLVHTRGREQAVWTLPTGLLALAAFRQGHAARGLELAANIALTARHGALGSFKELIPEGLCFVQLWSAALYIQVIVEGLLGLQPDAPAHTLTIVPTMPVDFPPVTLRDLRVGEHRIALTLDPGALQLDHVAGPQALTIRYAGASHSVAPASTLRDVMQKGGAGAP